MTALPRSLVDNPRLEQWVRIRPDNGVTLLVGKVELGQGILTALAQIAAEELDLPVEMVDVVAGRTDLTPNEGWTSGSQSIQVSGASVRLACAEARERLRKAACAGLDGADSVPLYDGRVAGPLGDAVGYAELAAGIDWSEPVSGAAAPKQPPYRVVGTSVRRLDLRDAIAGGSLIHDLELRGLLHGRVLRPPGLRAELLELDEARVEACPGVVCVVRDGSFVGVLAEREEQALQALEAASAAGRWRVDEAAPGPLTTGELLSSVPSAVVRGEKLEREEPLPAATSTHRARFTRPFLAHASIGPSCALAQFEGDGSRLTVWSHSQNVFAVRDAIAATLDLAVDDVTVVHVPGAGCYGHNGADDAALDAALLARAVPGSAVRLQWSREDELAWAPFGSAMMVEIEASLDEGGRVVSWELDVWSGEHGARPGRGDGTRFLAARHLAEPLPPATPVDVPPFAGGGGDRNSVALYDFPRQQTRYHFIPALPLRTSSLRSLGGFANVFAIESFMDELAQRTGADPLDFRLRHLTDERAAAVILAVAELADWPKRRRRLGDEQGVGIGFARYKNTAAYCAVVAEVEAIEEVRVRRAWCAVDAGFVINPDGLANQIEGGIVQSASWTLKEQVRFDPERVTSTTWEEYPILRFSEVPDVEVRILGRPDKPSLGAGEAAQGPTAAAIANALTNALGVRVRDLPLTREAVIAAI